MTASGNGALETATHQTAMLQRAQLSENTPIANREHTSSKHARAINLARPGARRGGFTTAALGAALESNREIVVSFNEP